MYNKKNKKGKVDRGVLVEVTFISDMLLDIVAENFIRFQFLLPLFQLFQLSLTITNRNNEELLLAVEM